jgi:hypothetical protein
VRRLYAADQKLLQPGTPLHTPLDFCPVRIFATGSA